MLLDFLWKPRKQPIPSKAKVHKPPSIPKPITTVAVDPSASAATVEYPRPNLPRLYFSGKFYTDPSTTNNYVNYYDTAKFRPNYQLEGDELNWNGFWNPDGTATFAFVECDVTGSYSPTAKGPPPTPDTLIDQTVVYNRKSVYGKISDLDPQMQTVSALYGVRLNIGEGDTAFSSLLMPTSFRDMWGAIYNPNANAAAYIQGYCAVYQGVLKLDSFSEGSSTFLQECSSYLEASKALTDANGNPIYPHGALSVRFRVDWYSNDPSSPDFCYGNVSAYVTPWIPDFPMNFDAGRQLHVTPETMGISAADGGEAALANMAYAYVQKMKDESSSLFVDLVNSFYRLKPTWTLQEEKDEEGNDVWVCPYQNQGTVDIGYFPDLYTPDQGSRFEVLANVPYLEKEFEDKSGIMDIPLTATQLTAIEGKPLGIRVTKDSEVKYRLAEANNGFFVRADTFAFHIEPTTASTSPADAETQTAYLYCSLFGQLQKEQSIIVGFDSSAMQNTGQGDGGPIVGQPVSALTLNGKEYTDPDDPQGDNYSLTITTGDKGYATLSIKGGDCKNPRGYIDGQLYGLRYAAGSILPDKDALSANNEKVNILLFDVFNGSTTPSWLVDVLPIFKLYANLYPSMHRIVRLDDFGSVTMRRKALLRSFTVDIEDPMYMPTTRDLSKAKRNMIVDWLNTPGDLPFMNQTKEDVYEALQTIIELEHATMPPYLTAMFSIKLGYNAYIMDTLRDIAEQEMLHFAIACNILTAIGGNPNINKIGFVPKFPGPLPGGLRSGLIVRLRKCSKDQLKSFMMIEAPDEQYLLEDGESSESNPLQKNKYTIGWVYDAVSDALEALHPATIQFPDDIPGITDEDPRIKNQVTGPFGDKLYKIKSLAQAQQAIREIKEEGEGCPGNNNPATGETDPDTGLPMLSHYFRFAEIVKGKRLTIDQTETEKTYAYNGPRVELDMDGVYNMQDDPKLEKQPLGSQQRERMESFARKYQGLLNGLQIAFNGDPDHLTQCFGLMYQLTIAAQPLMEMPALNEDGTVKADGTTCGVSFQVPTVEDMF